MERAVLDRSGGGGDLRQHTIEIDAAMRRREWREPARRLLELTLAARPVAAARLVPRHGDVDEALEEVLLGWLGGAPRVLERLVRREELPPADQLQPALIVVRDRS